MNIVYEQPIDVLAKGAATVDVLVTLTSGVLGGGSEYEISLGYSPSGVILRDAQVMQTNTTRNFAQVPVDPGQSLRVLLDDRYPLTPAPAVTVKVVPGGTGPSDTPPAGSDPFKALTDSIGELGIGLALIAVVIGVIYVLH